MHASENYKWVFKARDAFWFNRLHDGSFAEVFENRTVTKCFHGFYMLKIECFK